MSALMLRVYTHYKMIRMHHCEKMHDKKNPFGTARSSLTVNGVSKCVFYHAWMYAKASMKTSMSLFQCAVERRVNAYAQLQLASHINESFFTQVGYALKQHLPISSNIDVGNQGRGIT